MNVIFIKWVCSFLLLLVALIVNFGVSLLGKSDKKLGIPTVSGPSAIDSNSFPHELFENNCEKKNLGLTISVFSLSTCYIYYLVKDNIIKSYDYFAIDGFISVEACFFIISLVSFIFIILNFCISVQNNKIRHELELKRKQDLINDNSTAMCRMHKGYVNGLSSYNCLLCLKIPESNYNLSKNISNNKTRFLDFLSWTFGCLVIFFNLAFFDILDLIVELMPNIQ